MRNKFIYQFTKKFAAIMLLFGLGLSTIACVTEEEFSDLHFDHAITKAELKQTQAQLDALQQTVNNEIATLTAAIAALQAQDDEIMAELADRFSLLKQDLANAVAALAAADEANLVAALAEVDRVEDEIIALMQENIDSLKALIANLDDSLSAEINVAIARAESQVNNAIAIAANANSALADIVAANDAAAQAANNALELIFNDKLAKLQTALEEAVAALEAADAAEEQARVDGDDDLLAKIRRLRRQTNEAIEAANAAIAAGDDALFNEISELLTGLNRSLQAAIDQVAGDLAQLRNDFNQLDDYVETLTDDLLAVGLDVDTLRATIEALATVSSDTDTNTLNAIAALGVDLNAAIDAVAGNLQSYTEGQSGVIGNINNHIQVLYDSIVADDDSAIEAAISDLRAELATLETRVSANETAITNLQADLATFEALVRDNKQSLLDLGLDIAQLDDFIGTVSSTLNDLSSDDTQYNEILLMIQNVQGSVSRAIIGAADANTALSAEFNTTISELRELIEAAGNGSNIDNERLEELIAALEESGIATETYRGELDRLFTEAGYTVNGNIVTKAEATITLRDTDFILIVDGINIGSNGNYLSGDAQDDFNTIDSLTTKRLNRLVWDPLTDIFYDKLEWISDTVVDGVYVETLTGGVTYRLDDETDEFIDATIDGVTYTDINEAIAAAEAFELTLPELSTVLEFTGETSGDSVAEYAFDIVLTVDDGDEFNRGLTIVQNYSDSQARLDVINFSFIGGAGYFPNDQQSITVTATHEDYEGEVSITLDNPNFKPELSTVLEFTGAADSGPGTIFTVNTGLALGNAPLQNLIQADGTTITTSAGNFHFFVGFGSNPGLLISNVPTSEETITVTVTAEGYDGEVTATFDNTNYVEPTPDDLTFSNSVFSYSETSATGTVVWSISSWNGNPASGATVALSNGTYIYYSIGGTDTTGTLAQITAQINIDYP